MIAVQTHSTAFFFWLLGEVTEGSLPSHECDLFLPTSKLGCNTTGVLCRFCTVHGLIYRLSSKRVSVGLSCIPSASLVPGFSESSVHHCPVDISAATRTIYAKLVYVPKLLQFASEMKMKPHKVS